MRWYRKAWVAWLVLALPIAATLSGSPGLAAAQVSEPVALELVLALDSSSSVSTAEYDLQQRGIAAAFRDPAVQRAILALGDPGLAVTLLQWSGGRM